MENAASEGTEKPKHLNIEKFWNKPLVGFCLFGVACFFLVYWYRNIPPAGYCVTAMAVVAGLMAVRPEMRLPEKCLWVVALCLFAKVEFKAISKDRREAEDQALTRLEEERNHFAEVVAGLQASLKANDDIMKTASRNLLQTVGGVGAPYFIALFPPTPDANAPIKIIYMNSAGLPLVDVSVDIMERPSASVSLEEAAQKKTIHYDLHTILPGIWDAPFGLAPGKRFYLSIKTRRASYYEWVNIDRDSTSGTGWKLSECLYRYSDNKVIQGKCDQ